MVRNGLLAVGVVIALVGGAAVFALDDPTDRLVGDGADGDGTDDAEPTATSQMANTEAAFDVEVDEIEECGTTCRDVTATLRNVGDESAEDVLVEINIYTDGELVWDGEIEVGTLAPGESYTTDERVDLGFDDAMTIRDNDGWVEIETVVRFDGGTQVFTEERQVI